MLLRFVVSLNLIQNSKTPGGLRKIHLLRNKAYIDGKWVAATNNTTFPVTNPANDKLITDVVDCNEEDARNAIEAASKAFQSWQDTTAKQRSQILRKWFEISEKNAEDLAKIVTAESGKPLAESRGEIVYGNSFMEWFADTARHVDGEIVPSPWPGKLIHLTRQPVGVVSIITPWNFPYAMITRKVSAALAAGCSCVIKPAEDTPLTALASVQLAHDAGIPPGVINVIPSNRSNAPAVGKELCQNHKVAAISFTGSTQVGKILYGLSAEGVKRISLELGGNAPFIVFPSADMNLVLENAMACKFRNNGQTCVCANRFLIHESVHDEFVKGITQLIKKRIKLGDGSSEGVTAGPLINNAQIEKVTKLVENAKAKGATAVIGGNPATEFGNKYYQPTVLTNVTPQMDIYHEEIFGPVIVCLKFKEENEALKIANSTRSGLASYMFSQDLGQVFRVSKKLEFGMVGINEGVLSCPEGAFGGIKESGIGREGSKHGIDEFTYIKYNLISGLNM